MVQIDGINYLTVDEACALLGVKAATIYAYVSRGVLRSYKQGIKRQRLYREDEVTALLTVQPGGTVAEDRPVAVVEAPRREREWRHAESEGGALPDAAGWMSEI